MEWAVEREDSGCCRLPSDCRTKFVHSFNRPWIPGIVPWIILFNGPLLIYQADVHMYLRWISSCKLMVLAFWISLHFQSIVFHIDLFEVIFQLLHKLNIPSGRFHTILGRSSAKLPG
jgi:hypothetical protein